MTKSYASRFYAAKLIVVILLTLLCYMLAISLRNYTMVSFPMVMSVCLTVGAVGGVLAAPLAAWFTRRSSFALNAALATVVMTGVWAGLFYTLNFAFADAAAGHSERAVVERKYRETHYRSRKVGRNRYVRGEPYYEYYFDVRYANGSVKPMLVSAERYRRVDRSDSITVNISRGLFGFPVIKGNNRSDKKR